MNESERLKIMDFVANTFHSEIISEQNGDLFKTLKEFYKKELKESEFWRSEAKSLIEISKDRKRMYDEVCQLLEGTLKELDVYEKRNDETFDRATSLADERQKKYEEVKSHYQNLSSDFDKLSNIALSELQKADEEVKRLRDEGTVQNLIDNIDTEQGKN